MSALAEISRRRLLQNTAAYAAATLAHHAGAQTTISASPGSQDEVQLSQIHGPSEEDEKAPGPFLAPDGRVGYAVVGLGRLAIDQILPAFGRSRYSKPVALVSGDRDKARKIAAQYGIASNSIYSSYENYEGLAANEQVQAIYVVLPNGMHEEYVTRGAKIGKHMLCEKPMATSSAEAKRMIDASEAAKVKLMIAYRQQYEPNNRMLARMVASGKMGKLRGFLATNSQQQGDPIQWRLKKAMAGGGCLPDVGLYCLNAARFLSGQEPERISAQLWQPKDDPRFREVEASISFSLYFKSGFVATCTASYDVHKSQMFRLEGTDAWADMSPAFAYHGNKLSWSLLDGKEEMKFVPQVEEKDQFALEVDHFSDCILQEKIPHTPGEEGLQDHRIMEAIYEAAESGKVIHLSGLLQSTRGPEPETT
ncbi:Gfo/Idh/MocA family oxidoreductase [Silvibacterium sp.]|uniref:Gfo/Idh/MocA family oxidoreductase n=1 Tax=Silvibacterium sp. TaxID=1964179 RepID=UPI0039E34AD0